MEVVDNIKKDVILNAIKEGSCVEQVATCYNASDQSIPFRTSQCQKANSHGQKILNHEETLHVFWTY